MRIGIDATCIGHIRDGMINYAINIINNCIKINKNYNYHIYFRNEVKNDIDTSSSSVSYRVLRSENRKTLQQIILPFAIWLDNVDIMFFPYNSSSILCPCKNVVTICDLHPYVIPEQFAKVHSTQTYGGKSRSVINKLYWKMMLKASSKKASRVISISETTKRDIENIFNITGEKIDVVYLGVDKKIFNTSKDKNANRNFQEKHILKEKYILCMGTHAYKNLEGSIRSFKIIKMKYNSPLKLVIVGNKKSIQQEIFQLVQELGMEKHVVCTGFYPDADLKSLYQGAELLLFPSFYEGFGLPILEAFACGTPVVTSTAGALPEVAGEAALFANPYDADDIASAALKILNDNNLKESKRQQGLIHVVQFSWEEAARRTLAVFEKVLMQN